MIDKDALRKSLKVYMRLSFNEDATQKTVVVFDVLRQVIEAYEAAKTENAIDRRIFDGKNTKTE